MNVFISYGTLADQVTALRLQALGAVNGLTIYVPPAYTRQPSATQFDPESAQKLREADVVLGVVGAAGVSEACRQELNAGGTVKPVIAMVEPPVPPMLQANLGPNLIVIDPANPDQTELRIVQRLKAMDTGQQAMKALIFLGTLALGLAIAPQD